MIAIIVALAMTAGTADASRSLRSGANAAAGYYGYNGMVERRHQNNVPVRRLLDPSPNQPSKTKIVIYPNYSRRRSVFVNFLSNSWHFTGIDGSNLGVEIQSDLSDFLSITMDIPHDSNNLFVKYQITTTRINSEDTQISIKFDEKMVDRMVGEFSGKTDLPPGIHIEGAGILWFT
jgi:hypothetical protein